MLGHTLFHTMRRWFKSGRARAHFPINSHLSFLITGMLVVFSFHIPCRLSFLSDKWTPAERWVAELREGFCLKVAARVRLRLQAACFDAFTGGWRLLRRELAILPPPFRSVLCSLSWNPQLTGYDTAFLIGLIQISLKSQACTLKL